MNDKLKKVFEESHKTIKGLSEKIGKSHQTTSNFIKKTDISKQYHRIKLTAEYLNCSIEDIIDEPKNKK